MKHQNNTPNKKGSSLKSPSKDGGKGFVQLFRKKLFISTLLFVVGIGVISGGIIFSSTTQIVRAPHLVDEKFSEVLLSVRNSQIENFSNLLEDMKDDPLNGLYEDKLPTPEEMFYEEWANDWFPDVDVPVIGGYIQSVGAQMIGNIDIDGQTPHADLNITSKVNPSELTQRQCRFLWNPAEDLSLVAQNPSYWIQGAEGNNDNNEMLKFNFNLSDFQLSLIFNWVNTSKEGWMKNMISETEQALNPFFLASTIIIGIISIGFGAKILKSELQNKGISKSKKLMENS